MFKFLYASVYVIIFSFLSSTAPMASMARFANDAPVAPVTPVTSVTQTVDSITQHKPTGQTVLTNTPTKTVTTNNAQVVSQGFMPSGVMTQHTGKLRLIRFPAYYICCIWN